MKNKIIILIGLLFTNFIIWNRFIRVRIPRSIFEMSSDLRVVILTILCLFYIIMIIYSIRQIFNIEPKTNSIIYKSIYYLLKNKYYIILDKVIKDYILEAPRTLFKKIYIKIKIKYISFVISSYITLFATNNSLLLFIITTVIPKTLVMVIFIIDVFYFQKLHYFFFCLILLGIPLIFNFIVFLLGYICEENMLYIKEYVNVFEGENINKVKMQFKDIPTIKEENPIEPTDENLDWLVKRWEIISTIYHQFPLSIYNLSNKYKDYVILFTYSGYFIGWSYYLFILFYPQYSIKFYLSLVFIIICVYIFVIIYIIVYHFKNKPLNTNDTFNRTKLILNEYLILGRFNTFCIKYNVYIIMLGITLYVLLLLKSVKSLIFSCLLYYIYLLLISLINLFIKELNNHKYILILLGIRQYIRENMINFYNALYDIIVIRPFVIKQGNYLLHNFNRNYKRLYFFIIIPHIILLFLLFLNIIYDNNLTYFLIIFSLIIPVIFNFYLFIINDLVKKNIDYLEIDIELYYENGLLKIKERNPATNLDLDETMIDYLEVFNIYKLTSLIIKDKNRINQYINPVLAVIYIIIASYYLYL